MTTEGVGGVCPNCQCDRTFYRYGTGDWFSFDACPRCGFAYGHSGDGSWASDDVIEIVLRVNGCNTLEELFALANFQPAECVGELRRDTGADTVFKYSEKDVDVFRTTGSVWIAPNE